jgi:hypothetical protein
MKTNEIKMNTCPKCGSPQESPELDGTTARIWFTCGSYGYADEPEQLVYRSDKCLVREEINTLQRKVEELQIELDFANEAIDQRERSRKETETRLCEIQAAQDYWHSKWKDACENARIKHKQVCELKRERNRLIDDLQASTIHSCGDSCSRPMCVLRRERDAYKEALQMCVFWAESISRRVTEDRDSINWTGLQIARKALADIQKEAK